MHSTAADLDRLRRELAQRFGGAILPPARPAGAGAPRPAGFSTGIAALDRLIPGGLMAGTLSLWVGEGTTGRTAAVRALVGRACAGGARVAVVDAGGTLDAAFGCAGGGVTEGLWVVRPPEGGREAEGGWALEALLRAGVFELLVLDGSTPDAAQAHRLRALARERGAALVVSVEGGAAAGWRADHRLEFGGGGVAAAGVMPGGRFRRRVRVQAGRTGAEGEVELVHEPADRLRPGAPVADRRPRAR